MKVPFPDDFAPVRSHREKALAYGLDLDREIEALRLHALKDDVRHVDWHAALHSWLLKAESFRKATVAVRGIRGRATDDVLSHQGVFRD